MRLHSRLFGGIGTHKLTRDIAYSLVSFAVLAISGLVINLVITLLRDAAALGVFNQSYAIYIMASQVATFGLHYSVLRHAAVHENDAGERGQLMFTAAVCALGGGIVVAAVIYWCAPWFALALDSKAAGQAVANAALGLTLFPLNKVLLAHLNALRHMRAYSLLQTGRYLTIMALVTASAASSMPIESAVFAFFAAEALTAIAAVSYLRSQRELSHVGFSKAWMRRHLSFGSRGLMSGMFAEFNSRVDVLLIGLFLSDRIVGIYSFAAMLADGLYNILAMVRLNFNPLLVRAMRDADWKQAQELLAKSRKYIPPATLALSLLLIGSFWILAEYLMPQKGLYEGMRSLFILLTALTVVSCFVPFDNLLLVTGYPGYQTLQQLMMVLANVVFGVLLLPLFGMEGVAAGTAVSYIVSVSMLLLMTRRVLHWNMLSNSIAK